MEKREEMQSCTSQLIDFIAKSPSSFHMIKNFSDALSDNHFIRLYENQHWHLECGGKYYVVRSNSSIIAFSVPAAPPQQGYRIVASHCDFPSFKLKHDPEIISKEQYHTLNVESYGSMIMSTWFDIPLSIAGRVTYQAQGRLSSKLIDLDRDTVLIPSLAYHMDKKINEGHAFRVQKEMLPLFAGSTSFGCFLERIADEASLDSESILSYDLFLYNRMRGRIWGANLEFFSAPRIDNTQCAWSTFQSFLNAEGSHINVFCVFDNEEVGSMTKQGASSTFLSDILFRINSSLNKSHEEYLMNIADSIMLSADNAHAVHPNYPEKADPVNKPVINGGPVIKFAANQKYCTDSVSAAHFSMACKSADVPYQVFVNHSDSVGGSTLGNLATNNVSVVAADIGLPQLAMHSSYETAGIQDTWYMIQAVAEFYSA